MKNEIKVQKEGCLYIISVDGVYKISLTHIGTVILWLETNFSPPIKVRWCVGTADQTKIKEKYSY
jgi:hypothetical protein